MSLCGTEHDRKYIRAQPGTARSWHGMNGHEVVLRTPEHNYINSGEHRLPSLRWLESAFFQINLVKQVLNEFEELK